jgi:hypothetical protein
VYVHERSGEIDQTVETPVHTVSPARQPRNTAAGPSTRGAGSTRSQTDAARIAASRRARPPIQTSGASASPPLKKRAQKQAPTAARAAAGPGPGNRSPAARTGEDGSIVETRRKRRSQTVYMGITA